MKISSSASATSSSFALGEAMTRVGDERPRFDADRMDADVLRDHGRLAEGDIHRLEPCAGRAAGKWEVSKDDVRIGVSLGKGGEQARSPSSTEAGR